MTATLRYDPAETVAFKAAIRQIPGYPTGEDLPIRQMVFESGALFRLAQFLRLAGAEPEANVVIVMDTTPMRRGTDDLKAMVMASLESAGWRLRPVWLAPGPDGQVHTDWGQIDTVRQHLRPGVAVLSVGAGTVSDIAKHACFTFDGESNAGRLPLVCFPTANSVSAYTSNMAPVFVNGVKRTLPSRYPDVLVCDLETLRDAPAAMTAAGVGDLLAAFNSYADWYLACQLGIDPSYSPFAQTLMGEIDDIILANADAIRERTLAGMELLAKLIALGGLAMSLSHATTPLSGYEHLISHVLDLLAETSGRPLAQHGSQVALAVRLTTAAWEEFMDAFEPSEINVDHCYPDDAEMRARIEERFGTLDAGGRAAAECWADYRQKLAAWRQNRPAFESLLANWPAQRAALQALLKPAARAAEVLQAVGAPLTFEQLDPPVDAQTVRFAFENAPLIRRRLTLGDLFVFARWDTLDLWGAVGRRQPEPPVTSFTSTWRQP
jgi:glycerol-1-phosphate dehydrogenase [NAD(P)+]